MPRAPAHSLNHSLTRSLTDYAVGMRPPPPPMGMQPPMMGMMVRPEHAPHVLTYTFWTLCLWSDQPTTPVHEYRACAPLHRTWASDHPTSSPSSNSTDRRHTAGAHRPPAVSTNLARSRILAGHRRHPGECHLHPRVALPDQWAICLLHPRVALRDLWAICPLHPRVALPDLWAICLLHPRVALPDKWVICLLHLRGCRRCHQTNHQLEHCLLCMFYGWEQHALLVVVVGFCCIVISEVILMVHINKIYKII